MARERASRIPQRGYADLAPDLVAEILSPGDAAADVLAKVADGSLTVLRTEDSLDGEGVLPGFRCPVVNIFA